MELDRVWQAQVNDDDDDLLYHPQKDYSEVLATALGIRMVVDHMHSNFKYTISNDSCIFSTKLLHL